MFAAVWPMIAAASIAAVHLVVPAGYPVRVALERRVTLKRSGQPIAGTVVDPIYAYDRIVIPAGSRVLGRVARLDDPPRLARIRAFANGNFSPARAVTIEFSEVILPDGRHLTIRTGVGPPIAGVTLQVAPVDEAATGSNDGSGIGGRAHQAITDARHDATQRARDAVAAITAPGRMERLRTAALDRLPYHPQALAKGTVFDAELLDPLDFGTAVGTPRAPAGTAPAPESILSARLATRIDSAHDAKGSTVTAVLTEPVFSADHALVLPAGTELTGEVTFVRAARRFHRNGQVRFLFESVHAPADEPATLLASLYSVQAAGKAGIRVDDEGGAQATESRTRFVAPALALMSLHALTDHDHFDHDGGTSVAADPSGRIGPRGVGGFLGWGLAGTVLGLVSRPVGVGLTAVGAARTVYTAVFGRGRDVVFPADTPVQVQLAPAPASR